MLQEKDFLTVKDVAEMLATEPYVLRFYEKELNLTIKRNSKGHRVYSMENVEMFKKIQDMREQGLQLKAIEGIVHDSNAETSETYEQLSSIQIAPVTALKRQETLEVDITDMEDGKVKQFSLMMKEMFMQALVEYSDQSKWEMKETIKKEVDVAVEEKIAELKVLQTNKNEEYYKKLDEAMREVQKMRREMSEDKEDPKKAKASFWNRFFKEKNQTAEL